MEKVSGDPQCDRGNPPNDSTGACQATEVDRQTERMLWCFHSSSSSLLLRLVMWVVWVINEFMFNLNLDQLAWATGSAIAPYVVYPYSCWFVIVLPSHSILPYVILSRNCQEGLSVVSFSLPQKTERAQSRLMFKLNYMAFLVSCLSGGLCQPQPRPYMPYN